MGDGKKPASELLAMTNKEKIAQMSQVSPWLADMFKAFGQENIVAIRASENGQTVEWATKTKEAA